MTKLRFVRETSALLLPPVLGSDDILGRLALSVTSDGAFAKTTAAVAVIHANYLADALEEMYGAGVWDA